VAADAAGAAAVFAGFVLVAKAGFLVRADSKAAARAPALLGPESIAAAPARCGLAATVG
jgi:hypothetical protein